MIMEELINEIIALEWAFFDKVQNEGGRAPCQDDFRPFRARRASQYEAWDEATLSSWRGDLTAARAAGRNPLAEKYPLQFTQTRTRFSNPSHFKAAAWLQQFVKPVLELNPKDMESRGIADGDLIEAFNDRGSFKCVARANNAVRPGSSRTFEAGWSKFIEEGNTQNVTNDHVNERDEYLPTGAPIPFNDTLIEVKKA